MNKPIEPQQLRNITQVLGLDAAGAKPSRRRIAVYGAIGTALLALLVWLAASSRSGSAVHYVSEPVVRGNLTVIVTATGSVQPTNHVDISSELSGTVRKVNVDFNQLKDGREEYLAMLQGMPYGDDPRQGFFRGNVFMHPGLRFQLTPVYGVTIPVIVRLGNLQATAGIANVQLERKGNKSLVSLDLSRLGRRDDGASARGD